MAVSRDKSQSLHAYSIFNPRDWSRQLVVLAALITIVFVTGGTSRYDTPHVMLLRPLAIAAAGFALVSFNADHWRAFRPPIIILGCAILLTALHLVPLPPDVWRSLPGREIIEQVDGLAGLEGIWRPLSMFPEGTQNALYSLSVPAAVLLVGVQLDERDRVRMLALVTVMCMASGLVGVAQAAGVDLRFYRVSSENAGLFANRNHQAAMLAAMFPMMAAIALCAPAYTRQARAVRLVVAAGMAALVPLILVTGSRMGLVVGVVSFACLAFMRFSRRESGKGFALSGLMQAAAGVLIAAGMAAATVFLARDKAVDRMDGVGEELRWPVWQSVIEFLPQYMPWGSGVGTFVPVYQIHEPPSLLMPGYFNQAHNDWLDIVLTAGLPGVILAGAALVVWAAAARSALSELSVAGHLRRCGVIVILVLAFASASDYPLRTPIGSALLAVAAVWAWSPSSRRMHKEG